MNLEKTYKQWLNPSQQVRSSYASLSENKLNIILEQYNNNKPINYTNKQEDTFITWLLTRPKLTSPLGIANEIKLIFTVHNTR